MVADNSQKLLRWPEHSIRKDSGISGAWQDDSELLTVCCGYSPVFLQWVTFFYFLS